MTNGKGDTPRPDGGKYRDNFDRIFPMNRKINIKYLERRQALTGTDFEIVMKALRAGMEARAYIRDALKRLDTADTELDDQDLDAGPALVTLDSIICVFDEFTESEK